MGPRATRAPSDRARAGTTSASFAASGLDGALAKAPQAGSGAAASSAGVNRAASLGVHSRARSARAFAAAASARADVSARALSSARAASSGGVQPARPPARRGPPPTCAAQAVWSNVRLAGWSTEEVPSGQPESVFHLAPLRGQPEPMGASPRGRHGVNFAVSAPNATSVTLCLFERSHLSGGEPSQEIPLDPVVNRTGGVWHVLLRGLTPGLLYGFRVDGPQGPGFAFDPSIVLLDPYARGVVSADERAFGAIRGARVRTPAPSPDGAATAPPPAPEFSPPLSLRDFWPQLAGEVPDPRAKPYDWEGDVPLRRPMEDTVIYEAHVRGFTAAESSGLDERVRGTYTGMVERLDYLASLGVTAVELMPVQEFNELEYASAERPTRVNFWGYSTVGFFAPMQRYSAAAVPKPAADAGAGGAAAEAAPAPRPLSALDEFRDLVKAAHRRGLEVIMDVVFNHTAEGSERGMTLSFRGLDARTYYMLAPMGECYNYSGCGNTFNANHPIAAKFVLDCLRYWVAECHVDGFRFDLASILTRAPSIWPPPRPSGAAKAREAAAARALRDLAGASAESGAGAGAGGSPPTGDLGGGQGSWGALARHAADGPCAAAAASDGILGEGAGVPTGTPLTDPWLVRAISEDPVLASTKLIAEAWDCDGLVQLGAFPHYGGRWSEWNGRFRDSVRGFLKGSDGPWASAFAAALSGSADVFFDRAGPEDWWGNNAGAPWRGSRGPVASVNFVTAHDGFTLADLSSYNEKHNEANGEDNRDGESHNLSWNCGVEGPTDSPGVLFLRSRQQRNMLAALLLSAGVPMLLMGDEVGHTKHGNNNTYCTDGRVNYLDWDAARSPAGRRLRRYVRALLAVRRAFPQLRRGIYPGSDGIRWHGVDPEDPDWSDTSRFLAFSAWGPALQDAGATGVPPGEDGQAFWTSQGGDGGGGVYVAFNAGHEAVVARLPRWEGRVWQRVLDSTRAAPFDALMVDDELGAARAQAVLEAEGGTMREHIVSLLPWSSVVCVSVPEGEADKLQRWCRLPSERGLSWLA